MSKSGHITYRQPTTGDLQGLVSVEIECFNAYYRAHRFTERQFRYYLKNRNTIAAVATMGGKIVGYVLGVMLRGKGKGVSRLYSIATVRRVQGRGIGRQLLQRFLSGAKRRGARRVSLEVAVENRIGKKLFETEGFRQTKMMPDYYGKGHDGIRMDMSIWEG